MLRKCWSVRCGADMVSARLRIVLDQPSPAARPGTRYAWQLWHTPATAKLHNAALLSVSASQSQAPFVAATAPRPLGESNRRYAKLPSLERSHSRRRFPVSSCPTRRRLRALVVGVAPWHQSGAARIVLVSGLRPVIGVCPRPPLCFAAARHQPCALVCPSAPRGGSLSPRALVVGLCYKFSSCLRTEYEGYRPKRPVSQRDRWLTFQERTSLHSLFI